LRGNMKFEQDNTLTAWFRPRKMAPVWGAAIGVIAVLIYWPGAIGLVPGLHRYHDLKPLAAADLWIGDRLHLWFGAETHSDSATRSRMPKICVVGICREGRSEYGPMPWPRRKHAELVRRLNRLGAEVIAFDVYFPGAADAEDDAAFARACREAGNIILPRWCRMPDHEPASFRQASRVGDDVLHFQEGPHAVRFDDGVFRGELHDAAETIYENVFDCGHMNVFYDDDLVARRVPVAVGKAGEDTAYLPLGVVAAMNHFGLHSSAARIERDALVLDDGISIPLDTSGCIVINYMPFGRSVDVRSPELRKIEADVSWLQETARRAPIEFYSYLDVVEGRVPANAFAGAVVLVGQTVEGTREDLHVTPYGNQFGVFVQAMLVHMTLTGRFLRPVSEIGTALIVLLLSIALATILFSLRFRGSTYVIIGGGGILVGLGVLLVFLVVGLLRGWGLILEATPFLMLIGFNLVGGIASSASRTTREADLRNREMDMLLLAGQRHIGKWLDRGIMTSKAIPGAAEIAMSASLSLRSPDIVAQTFLQAVPCEGCALLLVREGKTLSFERTVFMGFRERLSSKDAKRVTLKLARETLRANRPVVHSRRDADWRYGDIVPAMRNVVGLPVTARGQWLAAVLLFNKRPMKASPRKEFTDEDLHLASALRYQVAVLLENARRYRLEYAMFEGFAHSLAKAVDLRDQYTHGHSERVAEFSEGIARKLGLTEAEVEIVQRAATLHDVGKIGVSDAVLNKPGRLSAEEFAMIKAHAVNGYEILKAAPSFEALLPGIRNHHERYDGKGYPDGLKGKRIPLIARIIAAADAYDAMTSDRIYRSALPEESARAELVKGAGTQFDRMVVQAFLTYLEAHDAEQEEQPRAEETPAPAGMAHAAVAE